MRKLFYGLGIHSGRFVVVRAYFDDSGDSSGNKILAIGGIVGFPEQWELFDQPWKQATKELSGSFHATDAEALRGCCEGWTREQHNTMMKDVVSAIISCGLRPFGTIVDVEAFRKVFPGSSVDAYSLIFAHTAINLAISAEIDEAAFGRKDNEVHIWHEGGPRENKLGEIFLRLRNLTDWLPSKYLKTFTIGTKDMPAIQAADLIARETFKYADNLGERDTRIPVQRFIENSKIRFFPWDRRCLERLRTYGSPDDLIAIIKCMSDNPPPGTMKKLPE